MSKNNDENMDIGVAEVLGQLNTNLEKWHSQEKDVKSNNNNLKTALYTLIAALITLFVTRGCDYLEKAQSPDETQIKEKIIHIQRDIEEINGLFTRMNDNQEKRIELIENHVSGIEREMKNFITDEDQEGLEAKIKIYIQEQIKKRETDE
jgi:hypothetical protein